MNEKSHLKNKRIFSTLSLLLPCHRVVPAYFLLNLDFQLNTLSFFLHSFPK